MRTIDALRTPAPLPTSATTIAARIADATEMVIRKVELLGRETTSAMHGVPDDAEAVQLAGELDSAARRILLVSRALADHFEQAARRASREADL